MVTSIVIVVLGLVAGFIVADLSRRSYGLPSSDVDEASPDYYTQDPNMIVVLDEDEPAFWSDDPRFQQVAK